jgi:hypothetical protein
MSKLREGWNTLVEEVLAKSWPDSPELQLLLEIAFYAGASWASVVIDDEGTGVMDELKSELQAHMDSINARSAEAKCLSE